MAPPPKSSESVWMVDDLRKLGLAQLFGLFCYIAVDPDPHPEPKNYTNIFEKFFRMGHEDVVQQLAGMRINK